MKRSIFGNVLIIAISVGGMWGLEVWKQITLCLLMILFVSMWTSSCYWQEKQEKSENKG